jgi:hypothetical protein
MVARNAHQRDAYQVLGGVCASEPACNSLTSWGFTDLHSWISSEQALLFDTTYQKKLAYSGLLNGLSGKLPSSLPEIGTNLDCESGTASWTVVAGVGTLGNSAISHGGAASCVISGRTDPSHGIARTLTGLLTSGTTLSVGFWVRIDDHTSADASAVVKATLRLDNAGVAQQYTQVASVLANEHNFTLLSANVGVAWATTPSFARIFLEGPPAGTDIIVDDASVHLLAP